MNVINNNAHLVHVHRGATREKQHNLSLGRIMSSDEIRPVVAHPFPRCQTDRQHDTHFST